MTESKIPTAGQMKVANRPHTIVLELWREQIKEQVWDGSVPINVAVLLAMIDEILEIRLTEKVTETPGGPKVEWVD